MLRFLLAVSLTAPFAAPGLAASPPAPAPTETASICWSAQDASGFDPIPHQGLGLQRPASPHELWFSGQQPRSGTNAERPFRTLDLPALRWPPHCAG